MLNWGGSQVVVFCVESNWAALMLMVERASERSEKTFFFSYGKGCWCFCYFLALRAMFSVYTVRVIHTFFASPNRTPPALIQHHKSDPLCWVRREAGGGGGDAWEWELLYSDEEESWKRFSWYDEVNYFIFMLPLLSSVFIILLPFASAYARVGNVMMFCMFRLGFFAFAFLCLCYCINLYSFYYTQGIRDHEEERGKGWE